MDRTHSAARRLILSLLLGMFALSAPACSRMRTYRGQDSPLPGIPLLGRKAKAWTKSPSALAKKNQPAHAPSVAWSGQPGDGKPVAILDDPIDARPDTPSRRSPRTAAVAPAEAGEAPAVPSPPPAFDQLRKLVDDSRDRLAKISTYQVSMNRQERVGDSLLPVEDVLLSIRRDPMAVRLEWPVGSHKGREVLYSASEPGGLMHINMADAVIPARMNLSPTSPLVMKNSRHPITEAGLDTIVENLDASLKPHEAGTAPAGEKMTYDGLVTPPETGRPCHKITRVTAKGEIWVIALDAENGLPALVQENAVNGDLIEKYVFRDLKTDLPSLAEAAAFDPVGRWGQPKGLFGRMAQGAGGADSKTK